MAKTCEKLPTFLLEIQEKYTKIVKYCVRNIHMLACDIFDVAMRQFQNMQNKFHLGIKCVSEANS